LACIEFRYFDIVIKEKVRVNKKILVMMIIGAVGLVFQMVMSSFYRDSESSLVLGIALAAFGIMVAIQIVIYSKVKKGNSITAGNGNVEKITKL